MTKRTREVLPNFSLINDVSRVLDAQVRAASEEEVPLESLPIPAATAPTLPWWDVAGGRFDARMLIQPEDLTSLPDRGVPSPTGRLSQPVSPPFHHIRRDPERPYASLDIDYGAVEVRAMARITQAQRDELARRAHYEQERRRLYEEEDERLRRARSEDMARIMGSYLQQGVVTGRLSSQRENLSNLPRPLGRELSPYEEAEREWRLQEIQARYNELALQAPPPIVIETHDDLEYEIMARTSTRTRRSSTPGGRTVTTQPETKPPIYVWAMQSSRPRAGGQFIQYEVRLNEDGELSCNCPGWVFKKKNEDRHCKHTRMVEVESEDLFRRFRRGEALPVEEPTTEQLRRAQTSNAPKQEEKVTFGRFIDID